MSATSMSFAPPRAFTLSVPPSALELLKQKLALTILPDELEEAEWDYGVPLSEIKRLLNYWKDGYDWKKHEKEINEELGPMFMRIIDVKRFGAIDVHYVHRKSERKSAVPLLFVHGWPGSFLEVRKILPLLTTPRSADDPSFHVVALSLPGFGFSEAPKKRGFEFKQYAEVAHRLMLSLGYREYVTQGGDLGHWITRRMAQQYGGRFCKAWHTNMPLASYVPPSPVPPKQWFPLSLFNRLVSPSPTPSTVQSIPEIEKLHQESSRQRTEWFRAKSAGYQAIQSTQPQTVGYSLADSPIGLLAWIYEKLIGWSDSNVNSTGETDGSYRWEDDEILTWISIYYFSRAGPAASIRIYYEIANAYDREALYFVPASEFPEIPLGYSYFFKELVLIASADKKPPQLVFESFHKSGGHFAAYEKPDLLVGDLRKMFGRGGGAYGVVEGATGYDDESALYSDKARAKL